MVEAVAAVCRCICSRTADDGVGEHSRGFDSIYHVEVQEPLPPLQAADAPSFLASADQPLRGQPTKSGEMWHLQDEERIEPVRFCLYINGFTVSRGGYEEKEAVSFSPFALVRNCTLQVGSTRVAVDTSELKIFKLSLFTRTACYYFGVKGDGADDAEALRQDWVRHISKAVQLVTQSLYPFFSISCRPLASSAFTARRLMAGYLLYHEGEQVVTLLYCELHSHDCDSGCSRLVFYENELCQRHFMSLNITLQTKCFEKIGVNCCCFSLDEHNFTTRSCVERKLWLRAVSNVRVKLQNEAPTPSKEELQHYRDAIEEHVASIKDALQGCGSVDPLLRSLRRSRSGPRAPSGATSARGATGSHAAAGAVGAGEHERFKSQPGGVGASPRRSPGAEGGSGMATSPAQEVPDCQDGGTGGSAVVTGGVEAVAHDATGVEASGGEAGAGRPESDAPVGGLAPGSFPKVPQLSPDRLELGGS